MRVICFKIEAIVDGTIYVLIPLWKCNYAFQRISYMRECLTIKNVTLATHI